MTTTPARQLKIAELAALRLLWIFTLGYAWGVTSRDRPDPGFATRMYGPQGTRPEGVSAYEVTRELVALYTEAIRRNGVINLWQRFVSEQASGAKPWGGPDCDAAICMFVFSSGVLAAKTEGDELAAVTPPRPFGSARLHDIWDRAPVWVRARFGKIASTLQRAIMDLVLEPEPEPEAVESLAYRAAPVAP